MKDNLFEMLLSLFEKSLSNLNEQHIEDSDDESTNTDASHRSLSTLRVQAPQNNATRILTYDEQVKLTKASQQFLMRMKLWNIIDHEIFELIMNQFDISDSTIITLQETKWTIRNVLSARLTQAQLSFLDLVLYQTEDAMLAH